METIKGQSVHKANNFAMSQCILFLWLLVLKYGTCIDIIIVLALHREGETVKSVASVWNKRDITLCCK